MLGASNMMVLISMFPKSAQRAVGAPAFLSPEILRNETGPSMEADVYSYGIVIYEGLS